MQNIDKLYIRYPQGAGGHWLSSLLQKIKRRDWIRQDRFDYINFHDTHVANSGHQIRDSNDVLFSGTARFNFFLNFWWKKRVFENYLDFNNQSDCAKLQVLID